VWLLYFAYPLPFYDLLLVLFIGFGPHLRIEMGYGFGPQAFMKIEMFYTKEKKKTHPQDRVESIQLFS